MCQACDDVKVAECITLRDPEGQTFRVVVVRENQLGSFGHIQRVQPI